MNSGPPVPGTRGVALSVLAAAAVGFASMSGDAGFVQAASAIAAIAPAIRPNDALRHGRLDTPLSIELPVRMNQPWGRGWDVDANREFWGRSSNRDAKARVDGCGKALTTICGEGLEKPTFPDSMTCPEKDSNLQPTP